MTSDLIGKLLGIHSLKVIDWNSVRSFYDTKKDIKNFGRELGVESIITGNIQREGSNIKVNVFMTNVNDGSIIWTDTYNKEFKGILDLQDEISQTIADALEVKFVPQDIDRKKPNSIEAYEYYKLGEHFHKKFLEIENNNDFNTAEKRYKTAINIDTSYAIAYAGLADLYNTFYNGNKSKMTDIEKTKNMNLQEKYIKKAFNLNKKIGRVYTVNGYFLQAKGKLNEAYQNYKKGVKIDPGSAETNVGLANFLLDIGLNHLALKYYNKILELNPLDNVSLWVRHACLSIFNEKSKALQDLERILDLQPDYTLAIISKAQIFIEMKNIEKLENIIQNNPDHNEKNYIQSWIYAFKGQKEKAIELMDSFRFNSYRKPEIYSLLGMQEEAIKILTDKYEKRSESRSVYFQLKNNSFYSNIQDDPRFKELLANEKKKYDALLKKYGKDL